MSGCKASLRRCFGFALALGVLAAGLCRSGVASAEETEETERAARLFDAGVADLKLEKYEAACASLERSYSLEANLGTLIALGDCLERWGKLRSAAARFEELIGAVSSANAGAYRAPQLEYARAALARLAPQIPQLGLHFSTPIEAEARVFLDERRLTTAPEQQVSVDPGRHVIETQAPGREPWRLEVDVSAGERRRVALELGRASSSPPSSPPPSLAAPITLESAAALPPEAERAAVPLVAAEEPEANPWRTFGWGLGGLGVTGIGVGVVAGVMVLQTCPGLDCEGSRGKDLALVTDVGFGVGLAALAASALVLLNTEPPAKRVDGAHWRPLGSLDAHGGWLGVGHSF